MLAGIRVPLVTETVRQKKGGRVMKKVYYVGMDIAKNVFQVFLADERGRELGNRKLSRLQVKEFFTKLAPCTVGIEACGTAHYWARTLAGMGHEAKLIQPIRVKAFLGHRNKTDAADARAICEALMHPGTRFVTVKTEEQQERLHYLSLRERLARNCTEIVNQIRSFLAEHGLVFPKSRTKFEKNFQELLKTTWDDFSDNFKRILEENYAEYLSIREKIQEMDVHIKNTAARDEQCKKLQKINGIGPLTATAILAHVGDGKQFQNGRQMAAYLGLTPREHSSGGKQHLLGISKRGNRQVRTLLILAAHAVLLGIGRRKTDDDGRPIRLSRLDAWALALKNRIGLFKTTVALANKMARIAWVVLAKGEVFNPVKAVAPVEAR